MIPAHVKDNIINKQWRMFAKENDIKLASSKETLISNIDEAIRNKEISSDKLDDFISEELSRGNNRYMQISKFEPQNILKMQNIDFIVKVLKRNYNKDDKFNEICNSHSNDINIHLIYFNYENNSENNFVKKVSLCFKEFYKVPSFKYDDVVIPEKTEIDIIWCDIDVQKQNIIIKSKDRTSKSKKYRIAENVCAFYQALIYNLFELGTESFIGDFSNTLYKIYKDFTDTAEREFREAIKPYHKKIEDFTNDISKELGMIGQRYSLNIPLRIQRLFERNLIQHNFEKYISFFEGKKGIVTRLYFSDETGATVNARSGDQSAEGIAVADIYFDTRETIEELKALQTIWVTWFVQENNDFIKNSKTRIFVTSSHYVVHFLHEYVLKEEEEYVFSNIERYSS